MLTIYFSMLIYKCQSYCRCHNMMYIDHLSHWSSFCCGHSFRTEGNRRYDKRRIRVQKGAVAFMNNPWTVITEATALSRKSKANDFPWKCRVLDYLKEYCKFQSCCTEGATFLLLGVSWLASLNWVALVITNPNNMTSESIILPANHIIPWLSEANSGFIVISGLLPGLRSRENGWLKRKK